MAALTQQNREVLSAEDIDACIRLHPEWRAARVLEFELRVLGLEEEEVQESLGKILVYGIKRIRQLRGKTAEELIARLFLVPETANKLAKRVALLYGIDRA